MESALWISSWIWFLRMNPHWVALGIQYRYSSSFYDFFETDTERVVFDYFTLVYHITDILQAHYNSRPWATGSRIVATAHLRATTNINIIKCEVITASITAKHIIIHCLRHYPTGDIRKADICHLYTITCYTRWTTIQIILLDINAVCLDIRKLDV